MPERVRPIDVTIYHNPDCGTSRNTLALIRHAGIEPDVVEYLKSPPSQDLLRQLAARAGLSIRQLLREKGSPYAELGLADLALDDTALLDAMTAHPLLINRPIVVSPKGVRLCRPSDIVLDLLPTEGLADFNKEEGAPFLIDTEINGSDPGFVAALRADNLPVDDIEEPGRTFFAYRSLGGTIVGYGGYELHGADAMLRSIVVTPSARGARIGRNILPLLMRRAYDRGARNAWLLTTGAADFFAKAGFKPVERADAPAAIQATRQASGLCPAGAILLTRPIVF